MSILSAQILFFSTLMRGLIAYFFINTSPRLVQLKTRLGLGIDHQSSQFHLTYKFRLCRLPVANGS